MEKIRFKDLSGWLKAAVISAWVIGGLYIFWVIEGFITAFIEAI